MDLQHGTIRHRHEERITPGDNDENFPSKAKVGYFYHPRLNDFSEGNVCCHSGPDSGVGKRFFVM